VTGIDDWDKAALTALHEAGQAGVTDLVERVGMDQFDEPMARAWLKDAVSRGLVRHAEGSQAHYVITKKGSARIGHPPPASEEAGD
jgi:predicted transcriptional regulator